MFDFNRSHTEFAAFAAYELAESANAAQLRRPIACVAHAARSMGFAALAHVALSAGTVVAAYRLFTERHA